MWWEGYEVSGGRSKRLRERESRAPMLEGFWPSLCSDPVTVEQVSSTWAEQDRVGKEISVRAKGDMTQGRTTQRTGVNPQSNIHYILGYPPIISPTPQVHNYLKDGLPSTLLPSPHLSLVFLYTPYRCGWPPLDWSVRGCSFVTCKGLPCVFGSERERSKVLTRSDVERTTKVPFTPV